MHFQPQMAPNFSSISGKSIISYAKIVNLRCPLESHNRIRMVVSPALIPFLPIYIYLIYILVLLLHIFSSFLLLTFSHIHLTFFNFSSTFLLLLHFPFFVFFHNVGWDKNMAVVTCSSGGFIKHATSCSSSAPSTLFFSFSETP